MSSWEGQESEAGSEVCSLRMSRVAANIVCDLDQTMAALLHGVDHKHMPQVTHSHAFSVTWIAPLDCVVTWILLG